MIKKNEVQSRVESTKDELNRVTNLDRELLRRSLTDQSTKIRKSLLQKTIMLNHYEPKNFKPTTVNVYKELVNYMYRRYNLYEPMNFKSTKVNVCKELANYMYRRYNLYVLKNFKLTCFKSVYRMITVIISNEEFQRKITEVKTNNVSYKDTERTIISQCWRHVYNDVFNSIVITHIGFSPLGEVPTDGYRSIWKLTIIHKMINKEGKDKRLYPLFITYFYFFYYRILFSLR